MKLFIVFKCDKKKNTAPVVFLIYSTILFIFGVAEYPAAKGNITQCFWGHLITSRDQLVLLAANVTLHGLKPEQTLWRHDGTGALCVSVVPFGAADTCRKMWRSQMLNHSCPCVWLFGPRGETVKLLLWESAAFTVTLLLNLIFRLHLFYRRRRIFYSRCIFLDVCRCLCL